MKVDSSQIRTKIEKVPERKKNLRSQVIVVEDEEE
jgi:hypothetical protein